VIEVVLFCKESCLEIGKKLIGKKTCPKPRLLLYFYVKNERKRFQIERGKEHQF